MSRERWGSVTNEWSKRERKDEKGWKFGFEDLGLVYDYKTGQLIDFVPTLISIHRSDDGVT